MSQADKDLGQRVINKDRAALARAITLVESTSPKDSITAGQLLSQILPQTGRSVRLAVTGIPGSGKSTLIEKLGLYLISHDHKIAVLAIDPSSSKSGGSILADKTRMEKLSRSENAFIRPSPSQGATGGVSSKTRETILLCEAAGFDIIIVETMGVGQGELAVHKMVDFFLLLQIAGAGDELQGMKKGIIEIADAIVINKADGENIKSVQKAAQEIKMAMHYISKPSAEWKVPVISCSALENRGIDKIWDLVAEYTDKQKSNGTFFKKRALQNKAWMHYLIYNQIEKLLFSDVNIKKNIRKLEDRVLNDEILPTQAAAEIIDLFKKQHSI